jgi:hypothetical protein
MYQNAADQQQPPRPTLSTSGPLTTFIEQLIQEKARKQISNPCILNEDPSSTQSASNNQVLQSLVGQILNPNILNGDLSSAQSTSSNPTAPPVDKMSIKHILNGPTLAPMANKMSIEYILNPTLPSLASQNLPIPTHLSTNNRSQNTSQGGESQPPTSDMAQS